MANSNVSTRDTQLEKQRLGYIAITFSNMDATTEPKIQAGSVCEVAGTLYSFTTEESNTGWAGIGNSTQAYLYLDPAADGTSVSAVWTDTAPVWDEAKYGYYASGTSNRYVLRCYKDSSGNYTQKYKYEQLHGNRYIDGDIDGSIGGDFELTGTITFSGGRLNIGDIATRGYYFPSTTTQNEVYDTLIPYFTPTDGEERPCMGLYADEFGTKRHVTGIIYTDTPKLALRVGTSSVGSDFNDGNATAIGDDLYVLILTTESV